MRQYTVYQQIDATSSCIYASMYANNVSNISNFLAHASTIFYPKGYGFIGYDFCIIILFTISRLANEKMGH